MSLQSSFHTGAPHPQTVTQWEQKPSARFANIASPKRSLHASPTPIIRALHRKAGTYSPKACPPWRVGGTPRSFARPAKWRGSLVFGFIFYSLSSRVPPCTPGPRHSLVRRAPPRGPLGLPPGASAGRVWPEAPGCPRLTPQPPHLSVTRPAARPAHGLGTHTATGSSWARLPGVCLQGRSLVTGFGWAGGCTGGAAWLAAWEERQGPSSARRVHPLRTELNLGFSRRKAP